MASKYELASYLAALQSIMESKEDAGKGRGRRLGVEHARAYDSLMKLIEEDQKDEPEQR